MLLIKLSGVFSSRSAKMEKAERDERRTIVVIMMRMAGWLRIALDLESF